MRERPLLYFALGILVTTSIGATLSLRSDGIEFPDGTVQTTADTRRVFYLAEDPTLDWNGVQALFACHPGFHMASMWEILDPGNLRYITDDELGTGYLARRAGDSGMGPPSGAIGWVRTGFLSSQERDGGRGNCRAWESSSSADDGSLAGLNTCWDGGAPCDLTASQMAHWWVTGTGPCHLPQKVWCVQD